MSGPWFWAVLAAAAGLASWLGPPLVLAPPLAVAIMLALGLGLGLGGLAAARSKPRAAWWHALATMVFAVTVAVGVISARVSPLTLWAGLAALSCATAALRPGSGVARLRIGGTRRRRWIALGLATAVGIAAGDLLAAARIGSAAEVVVLGTLAAVTYVGYRTQAIQATVTFWIGCLIVPPLGAAVGGLCALAVPDPGPLGALGLLCAAAGGAHVLARAGRSDPNAVAREC